MRDHLINLMLLPMEGFQIFTKLSYQRERSDLNEFVWIICLQVMTMPEIVYLCGICSLSESCLCGIMHYITINVMPLLFITGDPVVEVAAVHCTELHPLVESGSADLG